MNNASEEVPEILRSILGATLQMVKATQGLIDLCGPMIVENPAPSHLPPIETLPQGVIFQRCGPDLVRGKLGVGGVLTRKSSCPYDVAPWLIARMIEKDGFEKRINTSKLLTERQIKAGSGTTITDWLKSMGMIRRVQGAFVLRNCNEHTYKDVLDDEFESLKEIVEEIPGE